MLIFFIEGRRVTSETSLEEDMEHDCIKFSLPRNSYNCSFPKSGFNSQSFTRTYSTFFVCLFPSSFSFFTQGEINILMLRINLFSISHYYTVPVISSVNAPNLEDLMRFKNIKLDKSVPVVHG